jgi:hypothetical protein
VKKKEGSGSRSRANLGITKQLVGLFDVGLSDAVAAVGFGEDFGRSEQLHGVAQGLGGATDFGQCIQRFGLDFDVLRLRANRANLTTPHEESSEGQKITMGMREPQSEEPSALKGITQKKIS